MYRVMKGASIECNGKVYREGDQIANPGQNLIDSGSVELVIDEVAEEKPKKKPDGKKKVK